MSVRPFLHYLFVPNVILYYAHIISRIPRARAREEEYTRQERDHYNLNIQPIILSAASEIATDGNCKTTTQERFWMLIKRHLRSHCLSDYFVLC